MSDIYSTESLCYLQPGLISLHYGSGWRPATQQGAETSFLSFCPNPLPPSPRHPFNSITAFSCEPDSRAECQSVLWKNQPPAQQAVGGLEFYLQRRQTTANHHGDSSKTVCEKNGSQLSESRRPERLRLRFYLSPSKEDESQQSSGTSRRL